MSFEDLFAEVTDGGAGFGHRQHVHLTWLALRSTSFEQAESLVSQGIQGVARRAGVPEKYHVTMTQAWLRLVDHHRADEASFEELVERAPDLLDKGLLDRFYEPATLSSVAARDRWVAPDRRPFPWA